MQILNRFTGKLILDMPGKADLAGANLAGADLAGADLAGANLAGANLAEADLTCADLAGANLAEADLTCADLAEADLTKADLTKADLTKADLAGANLAGALGIGLALAGVSHLPEGDIIGWKMCQDDVLVKLLIPRDAKRSHGASRKCRAEYAEVLEVIGAEEGVSQFDPSFVYRAGATVGPREPWDEDRWNECASGIHFFITREEAEVY